MSRTRPRDLLVVGLVAVLVGNLLIRLLYSSIPSLPLAAGVVLGVLGVAELVGGYLLRGRIERRRGLPPVDPLLAARAVVLAKASAVAGSFVSGLWAGVLTYTLPMAGAVTAAAADSVTAGIGLVCALVLVGAALWLEHCCRTPDDPEGDERPH
ncbi:DUF3180 domain-containing protein [Pseudonocardia sp. KRD-291]|nr:DUF3180 domain-containing protein [Pseudonocardia sp. KRD291]